MKVLLKSRRELERAGRWDIDFHLPATLIQRFPEMLHCRVDDVAEISKRKRDPSVLGEGTFQYVDIASIDVVSGMITTPQLLAGDEAPSRARKVISAYDVIVSTCRPTRGAIAIIPEALHDQICSTAFTVVKCKSGLNPYYLHFALRLPSTLEQFRKWSTGSSYPAILDDDVAKTIIPVPTLEMQDLIASHLQRAASARSEVIDSANGAWQAQLTFAEAAVVRGEFASSSLDSQLAREFSAESIEGRVRELRPIGEDLDVPDGLSFNFKVQD